MVSLHLANGIVFKSTLSNSVDVLFSETRTKIGPKNQNGRQIHNKISVDGLNIFTIDSAPTGGNEIRFWMFVSRKRLNANGLNGPGKTNAIDQSDQCNVIISWIG